MVSSTAANLDFLNSFLAESGLSFLDNSFLSPNDFNFKFFLWTVESRLVIVCKSSRDSVISFWVSSLIGVSSELYAGISRFNSVSPLPPLIFNGANGFVPRPLRLDISIILAYPERERSPSAEFPVFKSWIIFASTFEAVIISDISTLSCWRFLEVTGGSGCLPFVIGGSTSSTRRLDLFRCLRDLKGSSAVREFFDDSSIRFAANRSLKFRRILSTNLPNKKR